VTSELSTLQQGLWWSDLPGGIYRRHRHPGHCPVAEDFPATAHPRPLLTATAKAVLHHAWPARFFCWKERSVRGRRNRIRSRRNELNRSQDSGRAAQGAAASRPQRRFFQLRQQQQQQQPQSVDDQFASTVAMPLFDRCPPVSRVELLAKFVAEIT